METAFVPVWYKLGCPGLTAPKRMIRRFQAHDDPEEPIRQDTFEEFAADRNPQEPMHEHKPVESFGDSSLAGA